MASGAGLGSVLPELQTCLRSREARRALLPLRTRPSGFDLHQLRILGQPEERALGWREAAIRLAAAGIRVPGAESPRAGADKARFASAPRPIGAGAIARDGQMFPAPAGGNLRPRLPRPL